MAILDSTRRRLLGTAGEPNVCLECGEATPQGSPQQIHRTGCESAPASHRSAEARMPWRDPKLSSLLGRPAHDVLDVGEGYRRPVW